MTETNIRSYSFGQKSKAAVVKKASTKWHRRVDCYMTQDDYDKLAKRAADNNRSLSRQLRIDLAKANANG